MARSPLNAETRMIRLSDAEIRKIFDEAERDIARIFRGMRGQKVRVGSAIRKAQLRTRRRLIKAINDAGDYTQEGIARAVREATKSYSAIDRAWFARVGVNPDRYLAELAASAEASIAALQAKKTNNIALSDRVYRNGTVASGKIDDLVNSAIARGLSAAELAAEVAKYVNPKTPGGVRYASQRLARTEINNAFHQTAKERYSKNPFVPWVQWNLSGSHPKPDECNRYAEEVHDPPDGQAGWYPNGNVPGRPHPNCLCFITPVQMDEESFMERLLAGEYDDFDLN